jgi:hypothetical protein
MLRPCRRSTAAAAPPPVGITSTRRPLPLPVQFLSPGGLPRAHHDYPERPPAATSSSPWTAHREALILGLSRATASLQCLPSVLPVPVPNFEHSTHIPPPLSSLAPATHGIPVGSHHRTSSVPIHPHASFPVAHQCSSTSFCLPIATGTSSPTSATVAAFGLTVGSTIRAFPHYPNSLASTTSSL